MVSARADVAQPSATASASAVAVVVPAVGIAYLRGSMTHDARPKAPGAHPAYAHADPYPEQVRDRVAVARGPSR